MAATIKRSRAGVLLRAVPADGALLTVQLPRTHAVSPVGRGVLVCEQPQIAQLAADARRCPSRSRCEMAEQLRAEPETNQPMCG